MLANCWTQQHWKICCCSLTWMVMSGPISTTDVCAVWASTPRTMNMVCWGYLKAILVEEARKNSCYLSQRASVTLNPCNGTRNSSAFSSWSSGTEAEENRAGMGEGMGRHLGSISARTLTIRQWIKSPLSQLLFPGKSRGIHQGYVSFILWKKTPESVGCLLSEDVNTCMRSLFPS